MTKHERIKRMTLLAMLTAMGVVLRIFKIIPVPDVQPVTDMVMIVTLILGVGYGIAMATMVMFISNLVLGFGVWTIPQILSYALCALTVAGIAKLIPIAKHFTWQLVLATFLGFEYGFLVSIGMLIYGGISVFLAYYVNGLPFDCYHAIGNFAFYFVLYKPLKVALNRYLQMV